MNTVRLLLLCAAAAVLLSLTDTPVQTKVESGGGITVQEKRAEVKVKKARTEDTGALPSEQAWNAG